VSWFDAQAYAAWKGRFLPTRAQWTRAAYGDNDGSQFFPWGNDWKAGVANVQTGQSAPVESFPEDLSWSGCYDLAGNLSEWLRPDPAAAQPPDFGVLMPICGGNFNRQRLLYESDVRPFESRSPDQGFRCVMELPWTKEAIESEIAHIH
jgi:formylglycine-generating enzyme required for sulfatase activity